MTLDIQTFEDLLDRESVIGWSHEPYLHCLDDFFNILIFYTRVGGIEVQWLANILKGRCAWIVSEDGLSLSFQDVDIIFELLQLLLHVRVAHATGSSTLLLLEEFSEIFFVSLFVVSLCVGLLPGSHKGFQSVILLLEIFTDLGLLIVVLFLRLTELGGLVSLLLLDLNVLISQLDEFLILLHELILKLCDLFVYASAGDDARFARCLIWSIAHACI